MCFEEDHLDAYREKGLVWPPNYQLADATFMKWTSLLPRRAREVAFFYMYQPQDADNKKDESCLFAVHDLTVNIKWKSKAMNISPCAVCSSNMWLRLIEPLANYSS
eukprot:3676977-Lingulodinium_polyedra.AAC.1